MERAGEAELFDRLQRVANNLFDDNPALVREFQQRWFRVQNPVEIVEWGPDQIFEGLLNRQQDPDEIMRERLQEIHRLQNRVVWLARRRQTQKPREINESEND